MPVQGTQIILDKTTYAIPDALEIDPAQIIAEHNFLRVSIGKPDLTPEELQAYTPLFETLKLCAKEPFITDVVFIVGNKKLVFNAAYVTYTINRFGIFCDIEALKDEHSYKTVGEGQMPEKKKRTKKEKTVK